MLRAVRFLFVPLLLVYLAASHSSTATAQDWPRWNGPNSDGTVPPANLVEAIPAGGLPLLWEKDVGLGYSGPVVVNNTLVVSEYVLESGEVTNNAGKRDELTGTERIRAFDAATGEQKWEYAYDRPYALSYPAGPRATPTIADGRVYSLGAEGDLVCLTLADGKLVWKKNFEREFGTKSPIWGHAAAPLVDGNQVICMAGGNGTLVVSYAASTGKELWRSLTGDDVGYCPPSIIQRAGQRELLIWDPTSLYGLDPANGSLRWQQPFEPDYGMSVLPPNANSERLFASGEGISAMYRLLPTDEGIEPVWRGRPSSSIMLGAATAIFDGDHIYGADLKSGALVCIRATDGKRLWETAKPTVNSDRPRGGSFAAAFLLRHRDSYFILGDNGDLVSAKLSPAGYNETGRFHAIDPVSETMGRNVLWTYPAIADGRFYVRNHNVLRCYELADTK